MLTLPDGPPESWGNRANPYELLAGQASDALSPQTVSKQAPSCDPSYETEGAYRPTGHIFRHLAAHVFSSFQAWLRAQMAVARATHMREPCPNNLRSRHWREVRRQLASCDLVATAGGYEDSGRSHQESGIAYRSRIRAAISVREGTLTAASGASPDGPNARRVSLVPSHGRSSVSPCILLPCASCMRLRSPSMDKVHLAN